MFLRKAVCTVFLIKFATSVIVETNEATNITSYDPAELLAKIFNPNSTIASRQRGYGLVFEDQPYQTDEDHGQYGLTSFEENKRLKFEDDDDNTGPLRFEDDNYYVTNGKPDRPLKFEDQDLVRDPVTFQDDNSINQNKRKKRKRRRKPKNGPQNYPQNFQGVPSGVGFPGPGFGPNPYPYPGLGSNPSGHSEYPGLIPFRRRRRPKPSLASDALTAFTGALTSIALYDDYQCVPRLLCEAAGGGSLGANGVLDSIAGIQPLLALLSAYNGISTSPLFVFGRAVFLGMTSRGNTGTCRYAYPQCPTDPEQLIHYLNNHNGGFFRFFNAPLPNQNLEQFYGHLGQNGQNLEQLYNNLGPNGQYGQDFGQNYGQTQIYGLYGQQNYQQGQNYGLYQNHPSGQQGFQNIGQYPGQFGQNYGSNYDYNTYGPNVRYKVNTKLEKRIQNKPVTDDVEDYLNDENENVDTKWQFPEQNDSNDNNYNNNERDRDTLKFPEESQKYDGNRDVTRKGKSILFPENQYNSNAYSNKNYVTNKVNYNKAQTIPYYQNKYQNVINANIYKHTTASPFNENDYYYDHKHNFYVKKEQNKVNYNYFSNNNHGSYNYKDQNQINNNNYDVNQNSYNKNNRDQNQVYYNNYYNKGSSQGNYNNYNNYANSNINDNGIQTVYVIRGNGDPNSPEVVKVRPGQSVN